MKAQSSLEPDRDEADDRVATWKRAWLEGANAAWATGGRAVNPYSTGLQHSAWAAGWNWGGQNPDRRKMDPDDRLAHPHRRATDSTLPRTLKRAAAVGATGVTLYAITKVVRRWLGSGIGTNSPRGGP
jgi:hypothetical protein